MTVGSGPMLTPIFDAFILGANSEGISTQFTDYQYGDLGPDNISVMYPTFEFIHPCGYYVLGDFNGSGVFNIADIAAGFSYLFFGSPQSPLTCECEEGTWIFWPVSMDIDGSCDFNMTDISCGFQWLKLGSTPCPIEPCGLCPPTGP